MASDTGVRADAERLFQGLGEQVEAARERYAVPGVAVGVLHEGREYLGGFGVTNVENPLPVIGDTLFQIGSITKTFTALAAMRLAEQGRLDLDAPVRHYLPDLRLADPDAAARVTMRHLFAHTGGWVGDFFEDFGRGDDALAKCVAAMADLPQLTPLGAVWSYNNSGFYIAGRVIEVVTGQPYESVIDELIFKPLGMTRSFFFAEDIITYRVVAGHNVLPEGPRVVRPWALRRAAHPAGAIASTVRDMLRYARFQLGDGSVPGDPDGARLLKPESLAAMHARYAEAGSLAEGVGLAWLLDTVGGVRVVKHGGTTSGQTATFVLAPDRSFALTVLTNANRGAELYRDVTAWAFREYLGAADPEPQPVAMSEEQLRPYLGRYEARLSTADVDLRDGGLILQVERTGGLADIEPKAPTPPPVRLIFTGEDRVVALDPPFAGNRGEFLRDPNGDIVWFRWGGRISRRAT